LQRPTSAAPEIFLQPRAPHDRHTAHFHRTPDHPGRVRKRFRR
jgi:hypothetical protein